MGRGTVWTRILSLAGASASTLAAAVAVAGGCSDPTTFAGQEGGTVAAPSHPPPPPQADDGGGDAGSCANGPAICPSSCPITIAELEAQLGWKPPHPIQSVCTGADIQALSDAFDNTANRTYDDVIKQITSTIANATCLGCIVTDDSAAEWGPLVRDPMGARPNFGACYAAFPGSNDACGKAKEYVEACLYQECNGCVDVNGFDACLSSKTVRVACADPIKVYESSCGSVPGYSDPSSAFNEACSDIIDSASTLCQGGIYDGGIADGG